MRLLLALAALAAAFVAGRWSVVEYRCCRPASEATYTEHDGTHWTYTAPPEWVTTTSPRWDN